VKRSSPKPFGPALQRVAADVMPATLIAEVQNAWPQVAGAALAAVAAPVSERDGVVTVACGSAVWAHELDLLSERLAGALNEALGRPAVRRLRAVATPVPN
jgi:predicted nucleic acid-binding Zn ribbon protein